MSAMEDMVAGLIKKMLPPEVAAMLTPEKVKEFGDQINAFIITIREQLTRIETQQSQILSQQAQILAKLSELENVGRESRGKPGSKRPRSDSGSASGSGGNPDN